MIKNIIKEIKLLSTNQLIKKWQDFFKQVPSQTVRREFLIKHIVWSIQAKEQGGYSSKLAKKLEFLAKDLEQNQEIKDEKINTLKKNVLTIKSGTKLIREYQGKNHEVLVLEKGYQYNNNFYKSLSSIANEITGTRWNGKVFFGVSKPCVKFS